MIPPSIVESLAPGIKKAYVSRDANLIIKTEAGEISKKLIECEPELCMSILNFITPKIKAEQRKRELERKKLEEGKRELERRKKSREISLRSDKKRERPQVQNPFIAPSSRKSIRKTVILSLLVPGSGHVYLGKIRKGYLIFA